MSSEKPTEEQIEDAILSARFGDLDDLKTFVDAFGKEALAEARDERGNTVLHMCCGNGHLDVLEYLLPLVPPSLLSVTNETGSPAMHYAVANNNTECVKALVNWPEEQGGGLPLLKQKNASGRDAFLESMFAGEGKEEVSGWIEGYLYRVEGGDDEEEGEGEGKEIKMSVGDEVVEDEAEVVDELAEKAEALEVKDEEEKKGSN
ncbi:hypothetical protein AYX14_02482 [Cryptococcus neoformans]|nr:cytoplasmic protein [Cryptococcus neoformans var. grubii Bt1]OWZ66257.1 hypothetical protein AYX15_02398 [Cryptococcus neoformans var. grubii]OWZ75481.1 cytoplasmic protein [Cryptococcus neoformans var. grubii Bt85]OXG21425.1 cytoplasmic protein [Cryptococcus neoformans var. grubii Ze90-1]OXM77957.1 cytoplasmic protein [Cryptococcus neoformans var. grubii Bt63]